MNVTPKGRDVETEHDFFSPDGEFIKVTYAHHTTLYSAFDFMIDNNVDTLVIDGVNIWRV